MSLKALQQELQWLLSVLGVSCYQVSHVNSSPHGEVFYLFFTPVTHERASKTLVVHFYSFSVQREGKQDNIRLIYLTGT